ncbi:hypothetical protein SAMN02910292_00796 [Lachnospiraceae bacterium XBB2008]|nr:hypothetical protein SAMN02910292_00796 [Lachnospiraceae bacterium XBB2008]
MKLSEFIKKAKKLGLRLGFMKFIGYEAIFSCAFRKAGSDEPYAVLPHSDKYWYADPLIISRDGREIVFMERVDRETGIGAIAYSDITDGAWHEPVAVIEEQFHMSFPMCFEWDGELYMIPETEMDNAINLYRCAAFPDKWEKCGRFLDGMKLVDTVVLEKTGAADASGECLTFLASEYNPENDFYTRFRKFTLKKTQNSPEGTSGEAHATGAIEATDLGLVSAEYTLQSRMAGYPLSDNIFPVQRSTSGVYGYSVMFRSGAPDGPEVREMLPHKVNTDCRRRLIGVHTYSLSEKYEVIDVQYLAKKI